jgi:hypothetical protein
MNLIMKKTRRKYAVVNHSKEETVYSNRTRKLYRLFIFMFALYINSIKTILLFQLMHTIIKS